MDARPTDPSLNSADLTLVTLGGAALLRTRGDGEPEVVLGPGKPLALLIYLAFSPHHTASREHLVDLIWADREPDSARHALRQAVWYIRQRLGDDAIETRDGDLVLALELPTDRDAFLYAVDNVRLDEAVRIYRGDFLPGFAVPGGLEFEHWVDAERYRLRLVFVRAAEALVRHLLTAAKQRDAQLLARRARDADRAHEAGWRLLIEAHLSADDRVAALVEADALEQFLQEEGRDPEPATRAIVQLARTPSRASTTPAADAPTESAMLVGDLVGREREFAAVLDAWDATARGGRHVHLSAPAGLGKTRLLMDVHARLRAMGARAVLIRANPGERDVPCATAGDLAAALAALPGAPGISPQSASVLVGLDPSLSSRFPGAASDTAGEADALRRRTIALAELVEAVSEDARVAILVDDLHWADDASRRILRGVLPRLARRRVMVVTTGRPTPADTLASDGLSHTIRLTPLSAADIAAFLSSITALPDQAWAREFPMVLRRASDGSPLLVLESLQLAMERGTILRTPAGWRCPDPERLFAELDEGSALRHRLEQIERSDRWILLILSVAGMPLALEQIATAASRDVESFETRLGALEQRGVLQRMGTHWMPAHDEIAAVAEEQASSDALRAARRAVGSMLAARSDREPNRMIRAARLLLEAGADSELNPLVMWWVQLRLRLGDRRPTAALVAELFGSDIPGERVRAIARALPWRYRIGLTTGGRIAAAVIVIALLGAGAAAALVRPRVPPPDEEFVAVRVVGDSVHTASAPVQIRATAWDSGAVIDVRGYTPHLAFLGNTADAAESPDRPGLWAVSRTMPDSGGEDIFLEHAGGAIHRMTFARGDDLNDDWSPDGKYLAFVTARWSARSRYDIAVLDLTTDSVRRLTRSSQSDRSPKWSPDGTRIAFSRLSFNSQPNQLCWVTFDGSERRCMATRLSITALFGWHGLDSTLVLVDSAGNWLVAMASIRDGGVRTLPIPLLNPSMDRLSPDGNWLAVRGWRPDDRSISWYVTPVDQPWKIRRLTSLDGNGVRDVVWLSVGRARRSYLAQLRVAAPTTPLPLDATYHLQVSGRSPTGSSMPIRAIEWTSQDTDVASVDSAGVVHPHRVGTSVIVASAGGWRRDSVTITTGPTTARTVFHTTWTGALDSAWFPFGDPRPVVIRRPKTEPAFWVHGDSSFDSGILSRTAFEATRGLGLVVVFSTPLTMSQWQKLSFALTAQVDSAAFSRWDGRLGAVTDDDRGHLERASCGVGYPAGEGTQALGRIAFATRGMHKLVPVDGSYVAGGWHRVRVQIFPDGTCGFALDGKPVWRAIESQPLNHRFRVVIMGKSFHTEVLVGPVTVWQGVRNDVDWSALDTGHH